MYDCGSELLFKGDNLLDEKYFAYGQNIGLNELPRKAYLLKIFGENHEKIAKQLNYRIEDYIVARDDKRIQYYSYYQDDRIIGFDETGSKRFEWIDNISEGHAIYHIDYQSPKFLWLCFPTGQTICQIDLEDSIEIFRIGDYTYEEVYEPLNFPESTFFYQGKLYISNMGDRKLYGLDLKNFELKEEMRFKEGNWQYIKTGFGDFVNLDSGIYKL